MKECVQSHMAGAWSTRTPVWQPNPKACTALWTRVCRGPFRAQGMWSSSLCSAITCLGHRGSQTLSPSDAHCCHSPPVLLIQQVWGRPVSVLSSPAPRWVWTLGQETMLEGAPGGFSETLAIARTPSGGQPREREPVDA